MRKPKEKQRDRGGGVAEPLLVDLWNAFDPHSRLIKTWHIALFYCLLYEAFLLPYAVTFLPATSGESAGGLANRPEFQLFYAIELLFCMDFYVQLNTGYYQDGNVHRDTRNARMKYIKTLGFVLDVLAIVPLSLMPIKLPPLSHVAWLEVHKVLRMWRIPKYFSSLEDVFSKNFVILKLSKVLIVTAFLAHLVACARFMFGWDTADSTYKWLPRASFEQQSLHSKYVISLFWSLGLLTGVYEGELPSRNQEFLFTILVTLTGFALFTYLCAALFVLSKSESSQAVIAEARINQLRHLLSFHHVPEVLQSQVVEFIKRHYTDAESNDREVVKLLCPSISKDIQVELLKGMMAKIPLFKDCNDQFIVALTSLLEMISLPAHYTLFSVGDAGDYMYVLNSGVLNIMVNGKRVRELRQGSFFGEVSVFSKRPRSATVVTTSYCTLYRLSRFHTERVLEGYPHYAILISKTVDEIVNQRQNATATGEKPTGDEFMLTTLYQLSTEIPNHRNRLKKKKSTNNSLHFRAKKPALGRSKSSQNVSAAGHAEFSMNGWLENERKESLNMSPIILPKVSPKKRSQLTRSKSAFARHMSSGMSLFTRRSRASERGGVGGPGPQDAIQGFYDNLSDRMLLQQERERRAAKAFWSKLLLPKAIDATSPKREVWLLGLQLHLLFNWIFIPLLLSFPLMNCSVALLGTLHVLADLVLIADLYLNCHLTYMNADHEKVTHPTKIAAHYLRGTSFLADLLCLLPYDVLLVWVPLANPAWLRVPRLARIWRVHGHFREWELNFRVYNQAKLVLSIVTFLFFVHLVTCLHFGLTQREGFSAVPDGWMPSDDLDVRQVKLDSGVFVYLDPRNRTYSESQLSGIISMQYTRSLFLATTILTTRGQIVEPARDLQYEVALVIMLCGLAWTAYLIDMVQKRFTASALEQKEFLITRTRIQKFLRCQNAPLEVHHRVSAFLDFWWSSHRGAIASELLNELPETIKRQVLRSMCKPALQTISLMHGVRTVLDELEQVFVDNVKFILYGQGETIYRQGDYASGLFFLLEGDVVIISNGGAPRTIPKGGFIGTASLHLNESSVSYAERLTAITGCILLFLGREHLNAMHKTFPTLSMALKALEKRFVDPKLAKAQKLAPIDRTASGTPTRQKESLEARILKYLGLEEVVFDPDAGSTSAWEVWIFALMSTQSFKVIYDMSFGVWHPHVVTSDAVLVLLELCFCLDLFFQSRLGYYQYGNKIMELKLIKKRYVHSRGFWIDIAAILPLFVVNWMLPSFSSRKELLNLNKLLRLLRAPRAFASLENQYLNRTLELRIAKLVFVSSLLSHLYGCIWFNFHTETSSVADANKWSPAASLTDESRMFQYSAAIFWSLGLMSASYSGELPKTSPQCLFTVLVLLSGFFLFAFIVGNLSDVVELVDADTREFNAKLSSLRHLLAHFQLPHSIEDKLKTYFFFQRFHTITQEHILQRCLPPSLLTDIRLVHLQPMIMKVAFLSGMEGSVTRMLVSQFSQVLIVKDQYVCRYGEEGSDMYFVFTGILDVLVPIDTLRRKLSNERAPRTATVSASSTGFHTYFSTGDPKKPHAMSQMKKVNELTSGSYFGEVALFSCKPRSAHTRSRTSCVLYKLSRRSLELVFERYPEWKKKVLKIVNIQQEQQHLRNLYMEEQQDAPVLTDKGLTQMDAAETSDLDHNRTLSNRLASGSRRILQRVSSQNSSISLGTLSGSHSPIARRASKRKAGNVSELRVEREASSLWIDLLLKCTEAQSEFHVRWLKAIALSSVFMSLAVPYRISFDPLERYSVLPSGMRVLEMVSELLFAWDIWLNWNMREGSASMELYEQRHRLSYKKERLWWDALAAFPIDHFLSDFYTAPWFRINRCLKLVNFPHYMNEINRRSVSYETNRICTLWMLYFVFMHWCACAYFSISVMSSNEKAVNYDSNDWNNWSAPVAFLAEPSEDPSVEWLLLRFLRGFFFSTTAFVKRGKTFTPVDEVGYIFSTSVSFVGLLVMSFMVGEIANLYTSYISNEVEFRKNHIAINLYLERWQVSGRLKARAHAFLSSLWSAHRGVNYQALFDEIPQLIRTESIEHIASVPLHQFLASVFRPITTSHPHDRELEALLHAISQQLKYEGFPRDECVLVEGSVAKEMYFVVKGHLVSCSVSLYVLGHQNAEVWLKSGDFFGEQGLLGYSVSKCTVKTVCACDLLSLSSEALLQVILSRPLFQSALSIAVEAYREMCRRERAGEVANTKTEEAWGELIFDILQARKELWEDEALAANEEDSTTATDGGGTTAGAGTGDVTAEAWKTSGVQARQKVGLMSIRKPSECMRVFEMLLQLIVARGVLVGRTDSLHSTTSLYQENLPLMTTTSFRMLDDPKHPLSLLSKAKGGVKDGAGGESAVAGVGSAIGNGPPPAYSVTEVSDASSKTKISNAL